MEIKVLITSCGRPDLLHQTLRSFLKNQQAAFESIIVHEDHEFRTDEMSELYEFTGQNIKTVFTKQIGQHASIEKFLNDNSDKYYLHLEEDWSFENTFDWITESIKIMEADPTVIKVLARKGSPHPCVHDHELMDHQSLCKFGYIQPWENKGIQWHGFSWNPGITRLDLLKQFIPFPKWEQELAELIFTKGYKVVELEKGIYTHIGEGSSTHE